MRVAGAIFIAAALGFVGLLAWIQIDGLVPAPAPPAASTVGSAPAPTASVPAVAPAPAVAAATPAVAVPPAACAGNPNALGVARVVEIDTTNGPGFGWEHFKTHDFLRDRE